MADHGEFRGPARSAPGERPATPVGRDPHHFDRCGGAEEWSAIEEFGQAKEPGFRKFLRLPHGIPSEESLSD
jgi:hypothetical protein